LEPGNTVSIPFAISTYVYSWLGRYVPGKVVPIAGKIYLARDQNVSREALYLSSILDVIFSILSGFILSVVFLVSAGSGLVQGSLLLFVAIIAGVSIVTLFLADSRPFYHGVNYLLGMMERSRIETTPRLSLANRSLIILLFAVGQMMRGIGFYFFVLSLTPDAQNAPLYVMGIFVLAGALGAASFFVPAGLGVRDGVLAVGLKGCVPFEIATILAVTSRIWETVTDLLLLVIISAVTHGIALVKKHRS
jgi:hypothetical protein